MSALLSSGFAFAPSPSWSASSASVEASLSLAGNLASRAGARINRRIEAIRDPSIVEMSGVDFDLRLAKVEADRTLDPFLEEPILALPPLFFDDAFEGRPHPARELEVRRKRESKGSVDLWGNGEIEFGRSLDGMLAAAASNADLATGVDLSLSKTRAAGASLAVNRAFDAGVGALSLPSVSGYGTFAIGETGYLDLATGLGVLRNDARPDEGSLTGGEVGFATATFGNRDRLGAITLFRYGRLESTLVRADFGTGADGEEGRVWANRTLGVAGLKADADWRQWGTTLSPSLRVEVSQDLANAQHFGAYAKREWLVAPEVGAEFAPGWTAKLEHRARFGQVENTRAVELRLQATF
ncbi:hypothetical protein [Aureimonas sp. ME7]|uniref:hypothetical protein n=1 Tax=Aureimonas sp. ME7 TaxID=2744252 RepID=UPI0015F6A33B|nr:hypothetical protein [Aureimonas sp. ME7]